MRLCRGDIFALEEHLARLFKGLKVLKIQSLYSRNELKRYLDRVIRANHFREARLRLSLWREEGRLRIAIVGEPYQGETRKKYLKGYQTTLSGIRRVKTQFSHIKSLDYGCFRKAFLDAKEKGYDEAILLNHRGQLAEGSRTNIFFARNGILYTPAAHCGCLPGITRRIVLRLARQMGISCKMVAVGARVLQQAEEAFVTNSLLGVMPLTAVDGKKIGPHGAGPLTKKLMRAYHTIVHSSCPSQGKSV
jgi:branched-subunit amino acid aminotransferase/4-amino-4-deoxychorismate lyase